MRLDVGQHHGLTALRLQPVEGSKEGFTRDINAQAGNVTPTGVPLQGPRYRGEVAPQATHSIGPMAKRFTPYWSIRARLSVASETTIGSVARNVLEAFSDLRV
jgi:hypothetical protein